MSSEISVATLDTPAPLDSGEFMAALDEATTPAELVGADEYLDIKAREYYQQRRKGEDALLALHQDIKTGEIQKEDMSFILFKASCIALEKYIKGKHVGEALHLAQTAATRLWGKGAIATMQSQRECMAKVRAIQNERRATRTAELTEQVLNVRLFDQETLESAA